MEPLTPRERDILKLTMLGKSVDDVATILGLHRDTIRLLLTQLVGKLNRSLPPPR